MTRICVLQSTQTALVFLSDFLGHCAHLSFKPVCVGLSAEFTSRSSAA